MNKDMNKELQRLISKYNLEELVELKVLLDSELVLRASKLNAILGIGNTTAVTVPVLPVVTEEQTKKTTKEIFVEEIKEEIIVEETIDDDIFTGEIEISKKEEKLSKDITSDKKVPKKWYTKDMEIINEFDKKTRKYKEFTTDKEGVIYCTTSNYDPSVLGGQLGHNGKIYNFIYSTKFELPVVLGEVTLDYLKEIKDKILAEAPKDFVEAEKLGTKYMTDYGYPGRFYYDELEQGTFIFKTKDGYKGFTQGMSFRVFLNDDNEIKNIYTLKNGFFFSQNYENAFAARQMRLYPTLVEDIEALITKVNEQFANYDETEGKPSTPNKYDDFFTDKFNSCGM